MIRFMIVRLVSFGMWYIADKIYTNPDRTLNSAIWWRDIWIMTIGITTANILNWK